MERLESLIANGKPLPLTRNAIIDRDAALNLIDELRVAVPEEVRPTVARMAEVAEDMVARVAEIITERDVDAAIVLSRDDDEMDMLRRTSFSQLLSDDWAHGVEAAVDIALLGRYYERIADHAVSVANRVVFVVTGQYPRALNV